MKFIALLGALACVSQIPAAHADQKSWLYQRHHRHAVAKADPFQSLIDLQPISGRTEGTFDQVIDHFSTSPGPTFKQRYFIDSTFAQDKNSPVIYYFCGEGACEGASDTDEVNKVAENIHAYRVALEHRYYGTSQPFPNLESKNLIYLSMDQAIEDLASFQKHLQSSMQLTGKWISMGGSYAGELSAFYRLKHPELVVGALASSAPVLAKADFNEYDHYVAKVVDKGCLAIMKSVVSDIENKLKTPASTAEVKKLFSLSQVADEVDFLYVVADMGAMAVQYGYQQDFCLALSKGQASKKATEAYARAGTALMHEVFHMTPFQDSFQFAMSTNPQDYSGFGLRAWMYQSCTEFGFYQTAYPVFAESARSTKITLDYHNNVCNRLFGINQQVNTEVTNRKYYNQLFDRSVKNIYFTNGSNDPWSNLSIRVDSPNATQNPGLKLFTIAGAAHCDDLGDRPSSALAESRNEFQQLVNQWLSE